MLLPTPESVRAAARRIANTTIRTPLRRSESLSRIAGGDVWLKLETEQRTGSFKLRGAFNALASLSADQAARGVVASSAGNHGLGIAYAARELKINATIFVPSTAPQVKRNGIAALGATVNADAPHYDEAMVRAREFAADTGATFVHPCLGEPLLAGQGTVALEIVEELPSVATVITCVGGGGLLGGIGGLLRGEHRDVRIIGAQTENTNAMAVAIAAGHLVEIPNHATLADGLAGQIDDDALQIGRAALDDIAVISEDDAARAIAWLWHNEKLRVEGAGCVAVGAVLTHRAQLARFPAVCVVSGKNIDDARFDDIIRPR
ncbi:MAG TPA: threonine/serine dehydratase [Gemmatimonadaceae bacterium]|nr:threonine/serine dehydratase [Gemmatimonadaceae bacterium]